MSQKEIDEWNQLWNQSWYKHPEISHDAILKIQKLEFENFLNSAFLEEETENEVYLQALENGETLKSPEPPPPQTVAEAMWWLGPDSIFSNLPNRQPVEQKASIMRDIFDAIWRED